MMHWPTGTTVFDHTKSHVCNCIGCCPKGRGCRTYPRHPSACEKVAALRQQIAAVYRGAA